MADWPLVGRQRELEQIMAAVSERRSAAVVGRSGVGRSRLLAEAARRLRTADISTVLSVSGTHTARAIPLGAIAPALPPIGWDRERGGIAILGALQLAHRALADLAGTGQVVVAVDDAHLLDPTTATVLEQAVDAGIATVVATCPDREASTLVSALWKDHDGLLVNLKPLDEDQIVRLAAEIVGGPIDDDSARRLAMIAEGNPLRLREALRELRDSRALTPHRGLWAWDGVLLPGPRLQELVALLDGRLSELSDNERLAMEALALAEPLPVKAWVEVVDPQAAEILERRGLVVVDRDSGGSARLAHPVQGEVLRAELPTTAARRLRRELADALERCDAAADASLQIAVLRVDADGPIDGEAMAGAADAALGHGAPELAARLAAAAVAAGAGPRARVALGEALVLGGHPQEAESHLRVVPTGQLDDDLLVRLVTARVDALVHGLGRVDEAAAVIEAVCPRLVADRARDLVLSAWASALAIHGRHRESVEIASRLSCDADLTVRLRVWPAVNLALVQEGRIDSAVRDLEHLLHISAGQPGRLCDLAEMDQTVLATLLASYLLAGRLDDAEELAAELSADPQPGRRGGSQVYLNVLRGKAALLRGRARTAQTYLRSGLLGHDRIEAVAWKAWALGLLAEACALVGDLDEAWSLAAECEVELVAAPPILVPDIRRALAWVHAAWGELSAAIFELEQVATEAANTPLPASELVALHDALRLGARGEAIRRITAIGPAIESRWVEPFVRHAQGLAEHDVELLASAADAFADLGALLCAAEAATHAQLASNGRGGRAAIESARAASWAACCEGASTPLLANAELDAGLTAREREVAGLAARGLASREIAARLSVSVRTVDNLLGRVYRKLGIRSRAELGQVLPGTR